MDDMINVLIVESDPKKLRRYASLSLWRELGIKVGQTACSSFSALGKMEKEKFGIVLTVSRPPEADASVILKKCRETGTAAIVIAARKDGESAGRYFGMGACDVIAEPPSRTRLRRAVIKARSQATKGQHSEEYLRAAQKAFVQLERGDEVFVTKLREFIACSEGEPATTGSAAEYFRFNRDYFGKLFKQETGMSFNSFYNSFRIEYAKELLASGRLRVHEISEMLGYSSVDYFTGVFRKKTGVTPSAYRGSITGGGV